MGDDKDQELCECGHSLARHSELEPGEYF